MTKLMIVQCGQQKIWKKNPGLGAVAAKDAYTSPYFQKNMAYAKRFGDRWMVLSAKYGFIDPDDKITDYNVTFKDKTTGPISFSRLHEQVKQKGLAQYDEIVVLGGEEYLDAIMAAFNGTGCTIKSPFKGLSIGFRMSAIDKAMGNLNEIKSDAIIEKKMSLTPQKLTGTSLTEEIRKYIYEMLILPAKKEGQKEITIRAGDVHGVLGLKSRMPMVCNALGGLGKHYPVTLINIRAPPGGQGANYFATYRI